MKAVDTVSLVEPAPYARVCAGEQLKNHKKHAIDHIKKLLSTDTLISSGELTLSEGATLDVKDKNEFQRRVDEFVASTIVQAEATSPGGMKELVSFLGQDSKLLKDVLQAGAKRPDVGDVDWLFDEFGEGIPKEALRDALELAGFGGRINVSTTDQTIPVVERRIGYTFPIGTHKLFHGHFREPRVVVIDGFIESVAEVTTLLESSHQSKEAMIMFHRGMHDDVTNTLVVNWQRGTLRCVPVHVPFDLDGINLLNDIAVAAGTDVISSLKGQLISTIDYLDLPFVNEVFCCAQQTSVLNPLSRPAVAAHVQHLLRKRSEVDEGLFEVYDKRIKALSPDLVVFKLPKGIDLRQRRQRVDRFLRAYKCLVDHGTIVVNDRKMLTTTAFAVQKYCPVLEEQIDQLGAVVTLTG